jgi:hypothetical protein
VLGRLPWMPGSLVLVGNAGIYAKQFVRNTASRVTQKRHSRNIVDKRKVGTRIEVELRFLILWILRGPGTHRPALANQVGRTAPRAVISAHKPWERFRLRRTLLTLTSTEHRALISGRGRYNTTFPLQARGNSRRRVTEPDGAYKARRVHTYC